MPIQAKNDLKCQHVLFVAKRVRKPDKKYLLTNKSCLETITNCTAKIGLRLQKGKYKVREFVEKHNHKLHVPETSHMFTSQLRISEVQTYELELAEDYGVRHKTSFDHMGTHVGGEKILDILVLI